MEWLLKKIAKGRSSLKEAAKENKKKPTTAPVEAPMEQQKKEQAEEEKEEKEEPRDKEKGKEKDVPASAASAAASAAAAAAGPISPTTPGTPIRPRFPPLGLGPVSHCGSCDCPFHLGANNPIACHYHPGSVHFRDAAAISSASPVAALAYVPTLIRFEQRFAPRAFTWTCCGHVVGTSSGCVHNYHAPLPGYAGAGPGPAPAERSSRPPPPQPVVPADFIQFRGEAPGIWDFRSREEPKEEDEPKEKDES